MRNEMICKVLILILLVPYVISDSCVRYTFEQNFNEWLTHESRGACVFMPFWVVGKYSDLDLTGLNERSTSFITPLPELSCVSSFIFSMNVSGTIEVNVYMEPADPFDQVTILANLLDITGVDRVTGLETHSPLNPNFVRGWHSLTITLSGPETYEGYISIIGIASQNSIVLVDSFRYIPPGMDESECQLYEKITTPDPTTVATPDPITTPIPKPITTTLDPNTPGDTSFVPTTLEDIVTEPTMPEETTADPTTPEETTPDPTTPEETTPEPTMTEETTPDPTTPEVTTPDTTTPEPTMPEETTPDPTTPEETTPDPTVPEETTTDLTTPEPTVPEETTPDLTTPEVTTPNPTTTEVTTLQPTTPETTTPDPTTTEETTPENIHRYLLTVETWIKTKLLLN